MAWGEVAPSLPPRERPRAQELAFGVVRLRGRLDHLLGLHLKKGLQSVPPALLPILRLGAYEVLYMERTPSYAAVSQAVSRARAVLGSAMGGLTNGVLRNLARAGGGMERFPSLEKDPAAHLSTWGSHPRWLVERWLDRFGAAETRRLVEANNRIPDVFLRPLRQDPEAAVEVLRSHGIPAEPGPAGSRTVRLEAGTPPATALSRVPGIIQDPGASWVVEWCGVPRGWLLVDVCAAPGGKAMALAAGGVRVVAADRSARRLELLTETMERVGIHFPRVVALGEVPPFRRVDAVLVDAPCSGTGTLARHPDARWRLKEADIHALSRVQGTILAAVASMVRSGGLLIYSTCTLEPEENDDQVQAFLASRREFILEGGAGVPEVARDGSLLRALPQRTGTDGAFAARLRRSR